MRVGRIGRGVLLVAMALGLGLASPAHAEGQYRKVVLVDGRVLYAEIVSTEPTGLLMRIPQGSTLIRFELLRDMQPSTLEEYEANQTPWTVVYDADEEVGDLLRQIEGINAYPLDRGGIPNVSPAAQSQAKAECRRDAGCIAAALAPDPEAGWLWVVTVDQTATSIDGESVVAPGGTVSDPVQLSHSDPDATWDLLLRLLDLAPRDPPRAGPGPAPAKRPFDEGRVVALSFVPVPGLPSLAQGDGAGFALAMGVVVPSTALWLGAVGSNGQSALETGVITLGGYYAVTVLANQVAGLRSMEKRRRVGVSAAPTLGGGAQVVLVGR